MRRLVAFVKAVAGLVAKQQMDEQRESRYIFCETEAHLDVAVQKFVGHRIVALTADCSWTCLRRKLPYQKLDDFYDDADVNLLAEETLRRHYRWAIWTDKQLGRAVPRFAAAGFQPARSCLYFLKVPIDGVLSSGWILREFARAAKPTEIVVFEREPFAPEFPIRVTHDRMLFSLLAPIVLGKICRVQVEPEPGDKQPAKRAEFRPSPIPRFFERVWNHLFRRARKICQRVTALSNTGSRVLMAGLDYGMGHSIAYFKRFGMRAVYASCPPQKLRRAAAQRETLQHEAALAWNVLSAQADFWTPSDAVDPLLRLVISRFMEHWLVHHVPDFFLKFEAFKKWLHERSFSAVVGSDVHTPEISVFYAAARALKIPLILHMHNDGTIFLNFSILDCIGPWLCDTYITSGEDDVEYFRNFGHRTGDWCRAKIMAVGSARLEAVRGRIPVRRPAKRRRSRILYVPTMLLGPYRYFNEGSSSDVAYFELEARILKIFSEYPETELLYKPFLRELAWNPVGAFLSREVPNARVIWRSLSKLINEVDAVIVDFPSTFLAEAVLHDLPLIVYAGRDWSRMFPQAVKLLRLRAQVAETPDDFEKEVRSLLGAKRFGPLPARDDSFALRYGIISKWNAAERAARVIADVASNRRGSPSPVSSQLPAGSN